MDRVTDSGETICTISFLNIMRYLQEKGIAARGYKMDWDTLAKGSAPVVVNYDKPQAHFVLLLHEEHIRQITEDEANRLSRLRDLARKRRRW